MGKISRKLKHCVIEPYFSLVVHLFVCIHGYLRSCVYVYIHVTCWPLEHTAFSKSKQGQMLCIFILTGYFPKFPQPEILYPTEPPDPLQLIRMPAPDRIKILSVCLICEDVFHMPNNYSCKSLSWICKICCNYTLKLLLKSTCLNDWTKGQFRNLDKVSGSKSCPHFRFKIFVINKININKSSI